jgi:hypothetical protein
VHKEVLADLGVKLWVSTSRAGATSRGKHTRVRKTPTQACDFFTILLTNHKVVCKGGLFMGKTSNNFFLAKRVE